MPPVTPPPSQSRTSLAALGGASQSRASRFFTRLSSSAALDATGRFLRRQLWAWPVIAAVVIGGAGWWVNTSIESALREQRVATMTTILKADVEALKTWIQREEKTAAQLAEHPELVGLVRDMLAAEGVRPTALGRASDAKVLARLRDWLAPRLAANTYHGFFLVTPGGLIIGSEEDQSVGKDLTGYRKEFFDRVLAGKPAVSKPYRALMWMKDRDGELRLGVPTMFAAAAVRDDGGRVIAGVGFRLRPDDDFTRILQTARAGQTGETYAFDRDGLMLSQSRFDDDMKQYGLLVDEPNTQSILTLKLRNPGANLAEGERTRVRRADMPPTKPVAEATAAGDGYDVDGYPDYRGVPNLGAWTWLDEYDFGVVTEVDKDEAFRPVYILRGALGVLLGLLLVGAGALFAAMWYMARQQQKLRAAVLEAKQLGQYTLEEKLGQGGMGTVYKARHAMLRRPTAVKLLDVANMTDLAVARFEREVQMTSVLTHPNTVAIYDYGRTPEGVFYYAMEYLDGTNLDDLVARYGPLPEARVAFILKQVCGALAEAHAAGLVHRDIKPANVFLTRRGGMSDFVKVLDFGLVKVADTQEANLTSANTVTGTPLYLSPEGISRPDSVGPPADVYALGAVAYYLLVGQPVFDGKTVLDICMKHVNEEPTPPSARGATVSPELEQVLLKCLAKSPDDRPPTAAALLAALDDCPVSGKWTAAVAATWWANPPAPATTQAVSVSAVAAPPTATADMTQAFVAQG
jgi:eukaryotic-like serine/threonine-protein kinase